MDMLDYVLNRWRFTWITDGVRKDLLDKEEEVARQMENKASLSSSIFVR